MKIEITKQDLRLILESLNYSKKSIEEYDKYPSIDFKQQKLKDIDNVIGKIKEVFEEIQL